MYNRLRRLFRSEKFINIVVGIVLFFFLVAFHMCYYGYVIAGQRMEYNDKVAMLEKYRNKIAKSEAELKVMKFKRDRLRTSEGIEEEAREKLGMVQKGEEVYIINGLDTEIPENEKTEVVVKHVSGKPNHTSFILKTMAPLLF
ncbi:septum formation initiator family protein [bacterium]|nr:septum formation initiator family protein [bacterium]